MHYKWTLHSRTSKQVKHLARASPLARAPLKWTPCYGALEVSVLLLLLLLLSMICKIANFGGIFSTKKKFVTFVKFLEWKKFVKFEFSNLDLWNIVHLELCAVTSDSLWEQFWVLTPDFLGLLCAKFSWHWLLMEETANFHVMRYNIKNAKIPGLMFLSAPSVNTFKIRLKTFLFDSA